MHEKYVFLQRSYSAPVRVLDISIAGVVVVVLRATALRSVLRAGLVRFVAVDLAVLFTTVVLVPERDELVAAESREESIVVRGLAERTAVVAVRLCVLLLREMAVPSRTAASEKPMQNSRFANKNRSFFISGFKSSKFIIFYASE